MYSIFITAPQFRHMLPLGPSPFLLFYSFLSFVTKYICLLSALLRFTRCFVFILSSSWQILPFEKKRVPYCTFMSISVVKVRLYIHTYVSDIYIFITSYSNLPWVNRVLIDIIRTSLLKLLEFFCQNKYFPYKSYIIIKLLIKILRTYTNIYIYIYIYYTYIFLHVIFKI